MQKRRSALLRNDDGKGCHFGMRFCCLKLRLGRTMVRGGWSQNRRKNMENFVIISEFMLDKCLGVWYHTQARVGEICGFFRKMHSALR